MRITFFLLFAISLQALGQDSTSAPPRIRYYFNFTSGMMAGEKARSITYSGTTTHGITIGPHLRIGAGIGIDSYDQWQAMPLYAQVSYDVLQRKNPLFIQTSYGWSHAWMQRNPSYYNITEMGGRMFSAMLGYRIAEGNLRVYVAAGYKVQLTSVRYDTPVDPTTSVPYPYYGYREKVDFTLERLLLTIGVGWR
jgi:hypothetical protein